MDAEATCGSNGQRREEEDDGSKALVCGPAASEGEREGAVRREWASDWAA